MDNNSLFREEDKKDPRKEKLPEYSLPEEYQKYDTRQRYSIIWLVLIAVVLAALYLLFIRTP